MLTLTALTTMGALALCSPRFVLPRGAAAYCEAHATNPTAFNLLTVRFISATGRSRTTAGSAGSCAPGGCGFPDASASAQAFTDDRAARRCQVLVDPATPTTLEITAAVHVDGQAIDLGPMLPCTKHVDFCPR